MFSASRPASPPPLWGRACPGLDPGSAREARRVGGGTVMSSFSRSPGLGAPTLPSPASGGGIRLLLRRAQLGPHAVEQFLRLGAFEPGDVILIFEEHAERVGHRRRIERHHVEL